MLSIHGIHKIHKNNEMDYYISEDIIQISKVEKNLMTAETDGYLVNIFKRMGGYS